MQLRNTGTVLSVFTISFVLFSYIRYLLSSMFIKLLIMPKNAEFEQRKRQYSNTGTARHRRNYHALILKAILLVKPRTILLLIRVSREYCAALNIDNYILIRLPAVIASHSANHFVLWLMSYSHFSLTPPLRDTTQWWLPYAASLNDIPEPYLVMLNWHCSKEGGV